MSNHHCHGSNACLWEGGRRVFGTRTSADKVHAPATLKRLISVDKTRENRENDRIKDANDRDAKIK